MKIVIMMPQPTTCEKCLTENKTIAVQCFKCGHLLKDNLSYEDTANTIKNDTILYTTYKYISRKDKGDMCIVTYKTKDDSVTVFLTFAGHKFKQKVDKEFMLNHYKIKCNSLSEFKRISSSLTKFSKVKFYKNAKGFYEILKLY